ncbi:MAG: hypothetical protein HY795_02270 [Desulfovibrio sp.]|nr:hypothetical protein [Desulfovibrio sp.]MBI4961161.1 hypothetical protein [Desulfovibrio sp.]
MFFESFTVWHNNLLLNHIFGGIFTVLIVGLLLSSLALYMGAKISRIQKASYRGAIYSTIISGGVCFFSNMVLSTIPILGNLAAFFISFLLSAAVTSSIFNCSFSKGLSAEIIRWIVSAALGIMLFVGSCAAIISTFQDAFTKDMNGQKIEIEIDRRHKPHDTLKDKSWRTQTFTTQGSFLRGQC